MRFQLKIMLSVKNKTAINLNNYKNIDFLCKNQIPKNYIKQYNKINSFFDKIYIETKILIELDGNITKIKKYLLLYTYNNDLRRKIKR